MTGEVAEWLNALVLKTSIRVSVSRVRIPPSPPIFTIISLNKNFQNGLDNLTVWAQSNPIVMECRRQNYGHH